MDEAEVDDVVGGCLEILAPGGDSCTICMEGFVFGGGATQACRQLRQCQHVFHEQCMKDMLMSTGKCAVCNSVVVTIRGNCPSGTMSVSTSSSQSLPGHSDVGLIAIHYSIPGGTQEEGHPHPGQPFTGTNRNAFLPYNAEGREAVRLLQVCWDRRLTFTVGTSLTTGQSNTCIWNGVHHKVSLVGDYLLRLSDSVPLFFSTSTHFISPCPPHPLGRRWRVGLAGLAGPTTPTSSVSGESWPQRGSCDS